MTRTASDMFIGMAAWALMEAVMIRLEFTPTARGEFISAVVLFALSVMSDPVRKHG